MAEIKISLAAARVNADMTLQDVADSMGVTRQTVWNWEHGYTNLNFPKLQKLSELYKIPTENIFLPMT